MKKRILTSKRAVKLCTFIMLTSISINVWSQVGVGTTNPDASAALEISSTTKGLLLPRMTQSQMEGISNPAEGLLVYCTNCEPKGMYIYNGQTYIASSTGFPSGFNESTDIVTETGKIWMNKNLGASQVATLISDHLGYGNLYQWGRAADGHEVINWTSSTTTDGAEQARETATTSATDTPGHDDFITNANDWRTTENTTLWQGASGTNNPCPSGYRIPTQAEWDAERVTWSSNNGAGAFASTLKLSYTGYRDPTNGLVLAAGNTSGNYWSSTVGASQRTRYLAVTGAFATTSFNGQRAFGFSVRCIKD